MSVTIGMRLTEQDEKVFTCGQSIRLEFLVSLLLSQRCWSLVALRLGGTWTWRLINEKNGGSMVMRCG